MEIILFTSGILIGLTLAYGIYGLLTFIIESMFGRKIAAFKYLFFSYTPSTRFHICNFSPICEITMKKENDTEKQAAISYIIKIVLYFTVCVGTALLTIRLYKSNAVGSKLMALLGGIALWFAGDIFFRTYFTVKTIIKEKNSLSPHYKAIVKKMLDGVPFSQIEVPDHRSYGCKDDKASIARYQHLVFMNRVWNNDSAGILFSVRTMEDCINMNYASHEKSYMLGLTDVYYDLLFYYSYFDLQYYRAVKIFKIIKPDLMKDHDSNGYRTLAYYTYYILKDEASAEEQLKKGLELLDEFPIVSQREYEKMLIERLLKIIKANHNIGQQSLIL